MGDVSQWDHLFAMAQERTDGDQDLKSPYENTNVTRPESPFMTQLPFNSSIFKYHHLGQYRWLHKFGEHEYSNTVANE